MSKRHKDPETDNKHLANTLTRYQQAHIIPHCAQCKKPCCMLTDVVLEFEWTALKQMYRLDESQKQFDRALHENTAPSYIRKMDGAYFTHGSPCPGFDQSKKHCTLYNSALKPQGCSDFPVYLDGQTIIADARCEALNIAVLLEALGEALPAKAPKVRSDTEFEFLHQITFHSAPRRPR